MSLYTIVGDPHAKPDNLDKIAQLFENIEELGNPCIILGDLLDTKELVRGSCLNAYISHFKASKLHFYVLVGNHDWFNLDCKDHSLEPLKMLKNVTIVDNIFRELEDLVLVPFSNSYDDKYLKYLREGKSKTLIGHFDIVGFDYGNGHISSTGLKLSDLQNWPLVVSGHYHKYQKVNNTVYLGSPFSHSFGESNQDKFLGILDTKTKTMELLPTNFQKHTTLYLNCDDSLELKGYDPKDKIRVILNGSAENIKKHKKLPKIQYIEAPSKILAKSPEDLQELNNPLKAFSKWSLDKKLSDKIRSLGLEVLENVQ
jgi:DNA repair exonuclease SbcCD nuclease subunit